MSTKQLAAREKPRVLLREGIIAVEDKDVELEIRAFVPQKKAQKLRPLVKRKLSARELTALHGILVGDITPERAEFSAQIIDLMNCVIRAASDAEIKQASRARNKIDAMLKMVAASQVCLKEDPLYKAKARGSLMQRRLFKEHIFVTTAQVSEILGISRQAIEKRRKAGKLLGFKRGRNFVYPTFQFKEGQLLPGLEDVLKNLKVRGEWTKFSFLVNRNSRLNNKIPLDLLKKGRIKKVLEAAESYGEQRAS